MPIRSVTAAQLRGALVASHLRTSATIDAALRALPFVQYDPIRRPERAQDLILFQRVEGYRAGDLDRHYAGGAIEEDHFYAYGAMTPDLMAFLHPRTDRRRPGQPYTPEGLAADVLALAAERAELHPRDAAAALGTISAVNDWGGTSSATTLALERLRYHGYLRVARRDGGVKVYEARSGGPPRGDGTDPRTRLRRLVEAIVTVLGPLPEASLRGAIVQLRGTSSGLPAPGSLLKEMVAAGDLDAALVDDLRYVTPPGWEPEGEVSGETVRFVAPFDPLVWDRRRFEHLWGWAYRFEAYTPAPKRQFGYYALPLFRGDDAIGWINAERTADARLDVETGFVRSAPRSRAFRAALGSEVDRLAAMTS